MDNLKKMRGSLTQDEQGREIFTPRPRDKILFESYMYESSNQMRLISRIGRHYSVYAIWQALKSELSLSTGLVHKSQAEIGEMISMSPPQVSKGFQLLAAEDLIRLYPSSKGDAAGFILCPDLVAIGDHERAHAKWSVACPVIKRPAPPKKTKLRAVA